MPQLQSELTLDIEQQVEINAPLEAAFAALLAQLAPPREEAAPPLPPLKLEPWPGGRWYRDLNGQNGHLWGHVQVIKRPALLEITGPLFMSYPALSHVQCRLTASKTGTLLVLRHRAFGLISEDHRAGTPQGWDTLLKGVKVRAERA